MKIAFFLESQDLSKLPWAGEAIALANVMTSPNNTLALYTEQLSDAEGFERQKLSSKIRVLYPFKKWNWPETFRLFPVLMQEQPELIQIIQPKDLSLFGGFSLLTQLPQIFEQFTHRRPALSLALFELSNNYHKWSRGLRSLILAADLITVSTPKQKEWVEEFLIKSRKSKVISYHPSLITGALPSQTVSSEVTLKTEHLSDFTLVPCRVDRLISPLKDELLQKDQSLVFIGWGKTSLVRRHFLMEKWGPQVRVIPISSFSPPEFSHLPRQIRLDLADLDLHELRHWIGFAQSRSIEFQISDRQKELLQKTLQNQQLFGHENQWLRLLDALDL